MPIYAQVAAPSLIPSSIFIGDPEEVPNPAMMSLNPSVDSWYGSAWLSSGRYASTKTFSDNDSYFTGRYHGIRTPIIPTDGTFESIVNPFGFVKEGAIFSLALVEENACDKLDPFRLSDYNTAPCANTLDSFKAEKQMISFSNIFQESEETIAIGLHSNRTEIQTDTSQTFIAEARAGLSFVLWDWLFGGLAHEWNQVDQKNEVLDITDNTTTIDRIQSLREANYFGAGLFKQFKLWGLEWGIHLEGYTYESEFRKYSGTLYDQVDQRSQIAELKIGGVLMGYGKHVIKHSEDGETTITSQNVEIHIIPSHVSLTLHSETGERVPNDDTESTTFSSNSISINYVHTPEIGE